MNQLSFLNGRYYPSYCFNKFSLLKYYFIARNKRSPAASKVGIIVVSNPGIENDSLGAGLHLEMSVFVQKAGSKSGDNVVVKK
jgi:hypothetical protein